MILTQARLSATLDRVADPDLRRLIRDSIAVVAAKPAAQQVPWKEYERVVDEFSDHASLPPDIAFVPLEDEELRDVAAKSMASRDPSKYRNLVRLDKVILRNFGSYREQSTIELNPLGGKNVTVVVGTNGSGKSTLFNGINWALFGDEFLNELASQQGKGRKDLVSHEALADLRAGSANVETEVVLWFSISGTQYNVRRRFTTVLLNGEYSPGVVSTVLQRLDASGNHEVLPEDTLVHLLSGLPRSVKDFYLFDGERINQFASPGSQSAVKSAISRIIGVAELEKVAGHLEQLASKLRSQHKKEAKGSVAEAISEDEQHRATVAARMAERDRLKENISSLKGMIATLDNKLRDAPLAKERQKRRDEYAKRLEALIRTRETQAQSLRGALSSAATALALPAVESLRQELNELRQAGDIPGRISQQLLEDLLTSGACLCGNELSEGGSARARLEAELSRIGRLSPARDSLLELFYELGALDKVIESHGREVARHNTSYWESVDSQEKLEEALAGISLELQGIETGNIDGWEAERSQKTQELSTAQSDLAAIVKCLEQDAEKSKELQARIQKLAGAEENAERLFRQHAWVEAAAAALKEIIGEFSALARIEVERRAETLWHQLLPNTKGYKVQVTDGFELNVTSPAGTSGMAQLSSGQQQCLGLAFITAVAQAAETRPPLVIDMPLGRLDEEVAAEVAKALPSLTYQLVLFVLPSTEWNEQTQAALEGSIARVVRLRKGEGEPETRISVHAA